MRLPIPPFLPPYGVLILVVAYAVGALWLGLTRLDDMAQLADSTTRNRATIDDLQAFQSAVDEIDAAGPAGVPVSAGARAAIFERERDRIPVLLSALRDKMRDDAAELALVEEIVPLIARANDARRIEHRTDGEAGPTPASDSADRSVRQGDRRANRRHHPVAQERANCTSSKEAAKRRFEP